MPNPAALRWHKHREHGYNHKVISVEFLAERSDVYCLQVGKYHNFALAAGVFVHNCGMIAVRTPLVHDDLAGKPLARLREAIEKAIPLSAGHYKTTPSATKAPPSGLPSSRTTTARTAPRRSRRTGVSSWDL